jgi:hypothetical protein|tara:strand:+ start:84 stop:275 length:192 start_codon:yes stop_codon:yes gene_type:complete
MAEIFSIKEVRIKLALKDAAAALQKAKTLVIDGEDVPDDVIPRLEAIVTSLEEQLIAAVEEDS